MGEYRNVYRKIAKWTEIRREPEYTAVLTCGHPCPSEYEEPWSAAQKAEVEAKGNEVVCITCTREEAELAAAQAKVRELKGRRKKRGGSEPEGDSHDG